jgi:hypothetical protein
MLAWSERSDRSRRTNLNAAVATVRGDSDER